VEKLLLKAEEAANVLSISRSQVFKMVEDEELPYVKIGKLIRIPTDRLSDWIRERTSGGVTSAAGLEGDLEAVA
jgi:excisionase family DNA binding protein